MTRLYSETSINDRVRDLVSQNSLRVSLLRRGELLDGYVGTYLEQDSRSTGSQVYNDNYVAPLAGVQTRPTSLPISAFLEYRHAMRLLAVPSGRPRMEPDARAGVFFYDWRKIGSSSGFFNESYGEEVFSSRQMQAFYLSVWNKTGIRARWWGTFETDLYGEGILKRSSRFSAADNLQEAGPGFRVLYRVGSVAAALSIRRGWGIQRDAGGPYAWWVSQLVVSGAF